MAKCIGVIAEFNPFHNGHAHLFERAMQVADCSDIIVAMSGSFVQRGEPAAFDKYIRAKWALENGASIVLELPASFSAASAQRFARGGVFLLSSTGVVDCLAFGTEYADLLLVRRMVDATSDYDDRLKAELRRCLASGKSFPAARACAIHECYRDDVLSAAMESPNNILACEYVRAIDELAPGLKPYAVHRTGVAHNSDRANGKYASGSTLRGAFSKCSFDIPMSCMPGECAKEAILLCKTLRAPVEASRLDAAALYALRRLSLPELAELPDVNEGLENVIYSSIRSSTSAAEALSSIKSKRYTAARLRRIFASALLGLTSSTQKHWSYPLYIRVLGVREDSRELLGRLAMNASLPVVVSKSDYDALDSEAKSMFDVDSFSRELLLSATPSPEGIENEFSRKLLVV